MTHCNSNDDHKDSFESPVDGDQIFGLAKRYEEAALVLIPVPWEPTTSYGKGTANGPSAIFRASGQLDLTDAYWEKAWQPGHFMLPEEQTTRDLNREACALAKAALENSDSAALAKVNKLSNRLNDWLNQTTNEQLARGKFVGVLGGDHSSSYGAIRAMHELKLKSKGSFGILHFDAHLDLRQNYQGFEHSHASIMHNVLRDFSTVKSLVQVGIRDFSREEKELARSQAGRVHLFEDVHIRNELACGTTWDALTRQILQQLPQEVWISFDIDGLDPTHCRHTGTPVPGGLSFHQATYLIDMLGRSGKKIVGFDLVEVAPSGDPRDEYDANVGARILYKLCTTLFGSQGLLKPTHL